MFEFDLPGMYVRPGSLPRLALPWDLRETRRHQQTRSCEVLRFLPVWKLVHRKGHDDDIVVPVPATARLKFNAPLASDYDISVQ